MMAAGFLGLQEGRFGGSAALEADIAEAPEGAFADAPKEEAEPIEEPALTGEERRATAGTRQNLQKVVPGTCGKRW